MTNLDRWREMTIRPTRDVEARVAAGRVLRGRAEYRSIHPLIPWVFVGLVHLMESGCDFTRHLHNGDPLTARTVQHPAGRPANGEPPFTWTESARDALAGRTLPAWPLKVLLDQLERYNGHGYRRRGRPSPYLWAGSNHYEAGKFTADGKFDQSAVSKQIGAAVVLRVLADRGDFTPVE